MRAKRDNNGIAPEVLRSILPAVFAEHPKPTVSDKYRFIGTNRVLEAMQKEGFYVVEGSQASPREEANAPFVRHALRLRKRGWNPELGELHPEILLSNGHDGSACYTVTLGFFRLVCSNGLVISAGGPGGYIRVTHSGAEKTIAEVLSATQQATNYMGGALEKIGVMRTTPVTPKVAQRYAEAAMGLRWRGTLPTLTPGQVLAYARPADAPTTVWTLYNTVQENLLHRTHEGVSIFSRRRTRVTPVGAVKASMELNRGLWDLAAALLEGE